MPYDYGVTFQPGPDGRPFGVNYATHPTLDERDWESAKNTLTSDILSGSDFSTLENLPWMASPQNGQPVLGNVWHRPSGAYWWDSGMPLTTRPYYMGPSEFMNDVRQSVGMPIDEGRNWRSRYDPQTGSWYDIRVNPDTGETVRQDQLPQTPRSTSDEYRDALTLWGALGVNWADPTNTYGEYMARHRTAPSQPRSFLYDAMRDPVPMTARPNTLGVISDYRPYGDYRQSNGWFTPPVIPDVY